MSLFSTAQKKLMTGQKIVNPHAVPRITRVVLNVGVGKHRGEQTYLAAVTRDVATISGQKPQERLARKAVSGFTVRQGDLVGYRVTLRGKRMEDFVERFVKLTLPRVRDFRGVPLSSLDGQGNLSVGVAEHLVFPEIHSDKIDIIFGVEVTFVTSAKDNASGEALFRALGFPLMAADADEQEEELQLETQATRAAKAKLTKVLK